MIAKGIMGLIYPPRCQLCGKGLDLSSNSILCPCCMGNIKLNDPPFCKRYGAQQYYFDTAYFVSTYDGSIRECIHRFKYSARLAFERLFGELMAGFAERNIDMRRYNWIVPVPLHKVKHRERTFNQSAILSAYLSRKFAIPTLKGNLERVRFGRPQIKLHKKKRFDDIRGAFKVKNPSQLKGASVLLVDDVFTTGATASECSRVLKKAGANSVDVFTLAISQ